MNLIFTAAAGRSGSNFLALLFNKYAIGVYAECEPPHLVFKRSGQFGAWLQNFQRKWIVTHEMLGRGKALQWYELDREHPNLNRLAIRRLKRIHMLSGRNGFHTYVETGKFFVKTQFDTMYLNAPHLWLMKLSRDPLLNARSFCNRDKDYFLDNVAPHCQQNCLQLDTKRLSKFQLYLWNWFETELRYYHFMNTYTIEKSYEIRTEDLNDTSKVKDIFRAFGLDHDEIEPLNPINTNLSQGKQATQVTKADIDEFERFIDIVPSKYIDRIPYLHTYDPYIHTS